jgi:hypothetical protein
MGGYLAKWTGGWSAVNKRRVVSDEARSHIRALLTMVRILGFTEHTGKLSVKGRHE